MIVLLFVSGSPDAEKRIYSGGGEKHYARLCKKNENNEWHSRDGCVHCVLHTFDFDVSNVGEFMRFMATLNNGGGCKVLVVEGPKYMAENLTCCSCSLQKCSWCHERKRDTNV